MASATYSQVEQYVADYNFSSSVGTSIPRTTIFQADADGITMVSGVVTLRSPSTLTYLDGVFVGAFETAGSNTSGIWSGNGAAGGAITIATLKLNAKETGAKPLSGSLQIYDSSASTDLFFTVIFNNYIIPQGYFFEYVNQSQTTASNRETSYNLVVTKIAAG